MDIGAAVACAGDAKNMEAHSYNSMKSISLKILYMVSLESVHLNFIDLLMHYRSNDSI